MAGISVQLPLFLDQYDGPYTLNKTIKDAMKQNLKNLILTSPGERIMDPSFGAGIRNYLFQNNNNITAGQIKSRIAEQVQIYLPHITILDIKIINDQNVDPLSDLDRHSIFINIVYVIEQLSVSDELDIKF